MDDKILKPQRRTIMMAIATGPVLGWSVAIANDTGELAETDELAMQLGYKADASEVDTDKFEKRRGKEAENQYCRTCQFYGAADQATASCIVFGGKKVSATGWCNSWFKRA